MQILRAGDGMVLSPEGSGRDTLNTPGYRGRPECNQNDNTGKFVMGKFTPGHPVQETVADDLYI